MKKEKGPAPPPPIVTTPKEPVDEKAVLDASIPEDIDNKPKRQEIIEPPTSTTPEDLSSQPDVCIWLNILSWIYYSLICTIISIRITSRSIDLIPQRLFPYAIRIHQHQVLRTVAAFPYLHPRQQQQITKKPQPIHR